MLERFQPETEGYDDPAEIVVPNMSCLEELAPVSKSRARFIPILLGDGTRQLYLGTERVERRASGTVVGVWWWEKTITGVSLFCWKLSNSGEGGKVWRNPLNPLALKELLDLSAISLEW